MIPIEETIRIVFVLQIRQTFVAPLLISVKGRQGLVIMSIVLVDFQLVITGNGGFSKTIAPSTEEVIHNACHRVIFI